MSKTLVSIPLLSCSAVQCCFSRSYERKILSHAQEWKLNRFFSSGIVHLAKTWYLKREKILCVFYKGDIRYCTSQNTVSHGIFFWNLKSPGDFNRELELLGRIFIWNLRMLLRGSILGRTLPDVTFIVHVYTSLQFQFG